MRGEREQEEKMKCKQKPKR